MGASFTNIQVRVGDRDPGELVRQIAEAIRQSAQAEFEEVSPPGEAHRTVVILPFKTGDRWLTICDEGCEYDPRVLDELASAVSGSAAHDAVSVHVFDSDVADVRLYRGGRQVDRFVNNPEYLEDAPLSKAEKRALSGDVERWRDLLIAPATPADLRRAWDSAPLLAEQIVVALAPLIGFTEDGCCSGFRDATVEGAAEVLRFRLRRGAAFDVPARGGPSFELGGWTPTSQLTVGETLNLGLTVRNAGGPGKGLAVILSGAALQKGLLGVASLRVVHMDQSRRRDVREVQPQPGEDSSLVAKFPEYDIPGGSADETDTRLAGRAMQARFASQIMISVIGAAAGPGEGALHILAVPSENPSGAIGQTTAVTVLSEGHRPLRFEGAYFRALREMEEPAFLNGLVVLGANEDVSATLAAEAIETWSRTLSQDGSASYDLTTWASLGKRPRQEKLSLRTLATSKVWQRARAQLSRGLATSGVLSPAGGIGGLSFFAAQTGSGIPMDLFGSGFTYQSRAIHFQDDEPCATLGLWVRIAGKSADRVAHAEAELVRLIDDLHSRGDGLQAFIARWAWAPRMMADSCPYELACGVHGQVTTTRAWCSRFLRAVTPQLWMGKQLLDRIDRNQLAASADLSASGTGLRLTLRASSSLAQLEETLAALLPGRTEWEAGIKLQPRRPPSL